MLIPYGAAGIGPASNLASLRHVRIDPSWQKPLRLNSGLPDLDAEALASTEGDMFSLVGEHLFSLCDPWSRSAREFLEGYLAFVVQKVEEDRAEIESHLRPYGRIYDVEDYRFSGWAPLPRAYIPVPQEGRPGALVGCDFAFWSGRTVIAIYLERGSLGPSRIRELDLLRSTGAIVVNVPPNIWTDPAKRSRVLPPQAESFWRHQALPRGPSGGIYELALSALAT